MAAPVAVLSSRVMVALVTLAGLGLAGCATQSPVDRPAAAVATFNPRPVAASFSVSGRIAARANSDTGADGGAKKGFSGGFSWSHTLKEDVVELLTPLGQIAARVTMTAAGATIELADGQRTTTTEPESFIARTLGISLPIAALPYWMQGAPVPGVQRRAEADDAGRLSLIWQNGWQIRYAEYSSPGFDAHPTRIDLTQGDVEVRMLIAEWKAPWP